MRLLITGALGFVGRYLIPAARGRGHEIFASSLESRASGPLAAQLTGYQSCDITDYPQVESLLTAARAEAIIHLAGQSSGARSFQRPIEAFQANATGALHLLEAARLRKFQGTILLITSSEAYGRISLGRPVDESNPLRPVSPYGVSKAAADTIAQLYSRSYGLAVIRARSFSHTGPGQEAAFVAPSWAQQVAQAEAASETAEGVPAVVKVGNLEPVRDIGDVRDVVEAYLDLLERGRVGEAYNVCTERGIKLRDLLDTLVGMASTEIRVESDPGRSRPTDIPYLVGSSRKIARELGWKPRYTLEETLQDLLDDCRKRAQTERPAEEHT